MPDSPDETIDPAAAGESHKKPRGGPLQRSQPNGHSRRKTGEDELRESDARYRAMFNQAHIGIVQIAPDGHFLAVNPGACALGGYSEAELLRLTVRDVTYPDDFPREMELTAKLIAGEIRDYALEKRFVRKDGEVVWGKMTATLVRKAADDGLYVLAIVEAIGERKRAEERLLGSEERYRSLFESIDSGFCVVEMIFDHDGRPVDYRFLETNPAFEKHTGLHEAKGRTAREMVPGLEEHWFETYGKVALTGEAIRFVNWAEPMGRWFEVYAFRLGAAESRRVAILFNDITQRQGAAEKLRESEERFRLLVEGARDYAMFLLDPESVITFWSSGAERIFGWSHHEAIGQRGEMIFTPEDRARGAVQEEIEIALANRRAPDRRFHLRKDGSRFWADGVLMRLDDEHGTLRGFAKVARDATDHRRIEDELLHARDEMEQRVFERTADLLATNKELERTIAQREQLERELLEISEREKRRIGEDLHDIVCQELTATALLLKASAKKVAPESRAAAEALEESAQLVNRNVGLARDLARGLQPADLKGAGLRQALRALAEQACENSEIKCHFKATRGVRVTDDTVALHLYRVAQEAMNNAVKHSGAKNILLTLDKNDEQICVSVQDDGKGFSLRGRSKGLGLHIMRYRANALGGHLKIEKRRRGGMEVTCVIPMKR